MTGRDVKASETVPGGGDHTLASLMEPRHRLEELLAKHQASLVSGDWSAADRQWINYFEGLDRCIREEEEFVLPEFLQRVPQTRRKLMEIFLAEHGRIRVFLSEISGLLDSIIQNPPPAPSQVVHLLEREYELKRLIEHHDTRDKNILLQELDIHTTEIERREILKRVHR